MVKIEDQIHLLPFPGGGGGGHGGGTSSTNLGFMELLALQDFSSTNPSIFDQMFLSYPLLDDNILQPPVQPPHPSSSPSSCSTDYSATNFYTNYIDRFITTNPLIASTATTTTTSDHRRRAVLPPVSEMGSEETEVMLNTPPTPNSANSSVSSPNSSSFNAATHDHHLPSSSSSPAAAAPPPNGTSDQNDDEDDDQLLQLPNTKKPLLKVKKTNGQKKQKEPRFAFMTKSEVDHLEDGYRWRKYGQKAVKNSPFPRSYYRCTTASCNVKKRVERNFNDPSIVVTTYEGQHIHPSPSMPRPSADHPYALMPPQHHHNLSLLPIHQQYLNTSNSGGATAAHHVVDLSYNHAVGASAEAIDQDQGGLLQDIFPSIRKKEEDI